MKEYIKNIKAYFKFKHAANIIVLIAVFVVFLILQAVGALNRSVTGLLVTIGYSIILAVSLNLVVGFLGELSLGHAGFMCVGAYIGGVVANSLRSAISNDTLLVIVCLIVGTIVACEFGLLIGLPALRLKGDYLAIVTLAFGEIVRNVCKNLKFFGGNQGLTTYPIQAKKLWIIAFVVAILMLILIQNFLRSPHGRNVTAIRDSEIAARAMGVPVTYYKLLVFMISSAFAGMAGVIYAFNTTPVMPTSFSYNYSIEILVMVVLGGMGSITGSIVAAALLSVVNFTLRNVLSGDMASLRYLFYAIILIAIVLYNNAPGLQNLRDRLDIRKALQKLFSKTGPDVIRDDEAKWHRIPTKINMDELLSVDTNVKNDERMN